MIGTFCIQRSGSSYHERREMLFSGLEFLGRRSKLKFLDNAFLYSGEGIVAFNISLRSTKFVTRSTIIAVACGARARSSHSTAAGLVFGGFEATYKANWEGAFYMLCCFMQNCYLWVDYHSVPQRNRTSQAFAFCTLPFVILRQIIWQSLQGSLSSM